MPVSAEFVAGLPKAELHVHIEGTLEPELKFELAERNGLELPFADVDELRASYRFHDLPSFLGVYYDGMRVLLTERDFRDLAYAYLRRAADQNVRHAEIFFDPQAHTSRGVPFPTVVRGLRQGVVDAQRDLGVHAELILCFLRDFSAEYAMATLMESLPYKDWIVGVGLDSDEKGNPPEKFAAVFARARAEGYLLTMHCDIDQENTTEHLRQVLEVIGVDRIDHGLNILEDEALVEEVLRRGIGLTACPISNGVVTASMKAPEIRALLDRGVPVSVNSDDPAYFGGYVSENLVALAGELDLDEADLVALQRNAFTISWLAAGRRDAFLDELDAYAREHGAA
ncbi:adenosine deaminase [Actinoalloteichus spitiensis]|uniref:adenosine deaminase n=1 Tax=Actinoalloteichus spitiensis TaxID=252394 RepID=UPI00037493FA|nr:adenosine deaminase [Actinoalloteichus spitiensis]